MNELFHLKLQKLKRYYIGVVALVSVIVLSSFIWNVYNESKHHKDAALEHARTSFEKDLMFRKWVASHGGVYVIPTEETPSNPYLAHIPNRDLITTTGMKLTLMNPAYTIRQLMENYEGMYGAKGHITSLKLLNPNNKASEWETKALKIFDKGVKIEFHEFLMKENREYIYYMRGLITQESCLMCHAHQGYKVGDIRGGVSIVIPMKKYNDDIKMGLKKIALFLVIFYIITLIGLFYAYRTLKESLIEQEKLYEANHQKEEIMLAQSRNAAMGEMISMIAHQWRQPISVIAMWANNITADIDMGELKEEDLKRYAEKITTQTQHLSQTIDDFRNFFRSDIKKEKIVIKDVMQESLSVINKSLENNNIQVQISYKSDAIVEIHARELMQVFINVIKNSKEALVENDVKNAKIDISVYEGETTVCVEIKDNALGIKDDVIKRIFDPYFTTKNVKSGTGLGLYMSKIIIEKHMYGTIEAKNVEDGVSFVIILPKESK